MAIKANNKEMLDVKFNSNFMNLVYYTETSKAQSLIWARPYNKAKIAQQLAILKTGPSGQEVPIGTQTHELASKLYAADRNDSLYYYFGDKINIVRKITKPGYVISAEREKEQIEITESASQYEENGQSTIVVGDTIVTNKTDFREWTLTSNFNSKNPYKVNLIESADIRLNAYSNNADDVYWVNNISAQIYYYDGSKKSATIAKNDIVMASSATIFDFSAYDTGNKYFLSANFNANNCRHCYIQTQQNLSKMTNATTDSKEYSVMRQSDGNCVVSLGKNIDMAQAELIRGAIGLNCNQHNDNWDSQIENNSQYTFVNIYPLDMIKVQGYAKYGFTDPALITKTASRNSGINNIVVATAARKTYTLTANFAHITDVQLRIDHEDGGSEPKTLKAGAFLSLLYQDNYSITSINPTEGYNAPAGTSGEITGNQILSLSGTMKTSVFTVKLGTGVASVHVRIKRNGSYIENKRIYTNTAFNVQYWDQYEVLEAYGDTGYNNNLASSGVVTVKNNISYTATTTLAQYPIIVNKRIHINQYHIVVKRTGYGGTGNPIDTWVKKAEATEDTYYAYYHDTASIMDMTADPGYEISSQSWLWNKQIESAIGVDLVAVPIAYTLTINVNTGINNYHVRINRSGKGGSTVDEWPTGYKSYTVYYGDTYSIDNVSAVGGWHSATGGGSGTITGSRTYTLSATRDALSVPRIDQEAPLDAYISDGRVIIDDSEGPIWNITNTTDTPLNIHVSYTVTVYDSSDSEIDYDYPGSESTNNLFPGQSWSCGLSGAVDCYDNDLGYYVELFARFTFTDSNDSSRTAEDTRSVVDYDIVNPNGGGSSGGGGSGGGGGDPSPDPDPTPDPDTSPDPDTR